MNRRGFRTKSLVIVTTLLSPEGYAADDIADLYRRRWDAELHLRSIKIVLQMDQLRCKTPHRVRNEFWMHLLAYNLIRRAMALAAMHSGKSPEKKRGQASLVDFLGRPLLRSVLSRPRAATVFFCQRSPP